MTARTAGSGSGRFASAADSASLTAARSRACDGQLLVLGGQHLEAAGQDLARVCRVDHVVDIAPLGGDVRLA